MKKVQAKFKVESVKEYENDRGEVELHAVYGDTKENEGFWKYTPGGSIKMTIDNPAAMKQFTPGQEFYVDFTPAVKSGGAAG